MREASDTSFPGEASPIKKMVARLQVFSSSQYSLPLHFLREQNVAAESPLTHRYSQHSDLEVQ
jgi:hypothetical protein